MDPMGRVVFKNPWTVRHSLREKKGSAKIYKGFFKRPKNAGCWPYVLRENLQNYLTFASSLIPPAKKNGNLMNL